MQKKTTAVLLAAGFGSRLGELTSGKPKPLIEIHEKPLIEYAINWLKYLEVKKIIVVGGYMIDSLKEGVKKIDPNIVFVENKEYGTTHRMVSLLKAYPEIEGDLLVQDADYIYHKSVADFIKKYIYNDLAVHATQEKSDYTAQDVIVGFDKNNYLLDIFKTQGTQELCKGEYYFNSLVYCPEAKINNFFSLAQAIIKKKKSGLLQPEDTILEYAKLGNLVEVVNTGKPLWIEVDTQEELQAAKQFVTRYREDII